MKFPTLHELHRRDAAYLGDRADWRVVFSRTRDDSLLHQSNWNEFLREFIAIDPGAKCHTVERSVHWACGWIDYLIVAPTHQYEILRDEIHATDDPAARNEILAELEAARSDYLTSVKLIEAARKLNERLANYPILNADAYSEAQWLNYTDLHETVWDANFRSELPDEDSARLDAFDKLREYFESLIPSGEYFDEDGYPNFSYAIDNHTTEKLDKFLADEK